MSLNKCCFGGYIYIDMCKGDIKITAKADKWIEYK